MKDREHLIIEAIGSNTQREYMISESKENLIIRITKSNEKSDTDLRERLEKDLIEFHPRIVFVSFV